MDYKDSAELIHLHNYEVTAFENATCAKDGYKDFKCSGCGQTYREDLKATGKHDYKVVNSKNATCEAGGFKEYKCSTCNHSYRNDIKATGHNYSSATCTEAKKCKNCGQTSGSALGHSTGGTKCSRCGTTTFKALSYSGTGSKVIDYSLPSGKFKITVTMTAGEGSVDVKVHYTESWGDTYKWLYVYDAGNSQVGNINGPMAGTIVVNASNSYFGNSSWKITIEAIG